MSEYVNFTVTHRSQGYRVVLTQKYSKQFDFGHYHFAIYKGRHIVDSGWSSEGVPRGRANV